MSWFFLACFDVRNLSGIFGFKSSTAYFYFYSTLAQSMAALLGVLGVFAVYRLEIQSNRISELYKNFADFCVGIAISGREAQIRALPRQDLLRYPATGGPGFQGYGSQVNLMTQQIKQEERRREDVKEAFSWATIPLAILVLNGLFLTGHGDDLFSSQKLAIVVTGGHFLLILVTLILVLRFSYLCVKGE